MRYREEVRHKVKGRGETCVGPLDAMIAQQEHNCHQARVSIVQ